MTDKERLSLEILKKWRELRRDLLYLMHGEKWTEHDDRYGNFFGPANDVEKKELELLAAIADDKK